MTPEQQIGFLITKIFFTGFGALALFIGIKLYRREKAFLEKSIKTMGEVIDFVEEVSHGNKGSHIVYKPVVRFKAQSGQTVQFTSGFGMNPPQYEKGQTISVIYDPTNPDEAQTEGLLSEWLLPIGAMVMGGIGLLAGICLFVFA